LTDELFEGFDPLADRRGRHMQPLGCGVEAALLNHCGQGGQLVWVQVCGMVIAHRLIIRHGRQRAA
jgi:hypothetical protein